MISAVLPVKKISYAKSKLFFPKHTCRSVKNAVRKLTNIPIAKEPRRYLGIGLFMDGRGHYNSKSILKAKVLSFAGRVTLVKSVLNSMLTSRMQVLLFPKYVCDEIDKVNRDFILQGSESQRKIHLVDWNTICKAQP